VFGWPRSGGIGVELRVSSHGFLGPEASVLLFGERVQAFEKRLCEMRALVYG